MRMDITYVHLRARNGMYSEDCGEPEVVLGAQQSRCGTVTQVLISLRMPGSVEAALGHEEGHERGRGEGGGWCGGNSGMDGVV